MTDAFALELSTAARNLEMLSPSELRALLRRAATRAENNAIGHAVVILSAEVADALAVFAREAGVTRNEAANIALRDWCTRSGLLRD